MVKFSQWLQTQHLIPRLLALLSPYHQPTLHTTVAEVLKHIIGLSALSPFNPAGGNAILQQQQVLISPAGDSSMQDQQQQSLQEHQQPQQQQQPPQPPPGQRDNRLIRELVGKECVALLIGFIVDEVEYTDDSTTTDHDGASTPKIPVVSHNINDGNPYETPASPSVASTTSSLCNSINVLIELIRKNNSDFSEPHLFHTMRHRLIHLQQKQQEERKVVKHQEGPEETEQEKEKRLQADRDEEDQIDEAERAQMEEVMQEMSEKMGIVHLGELLDAFSSRIERLQDLLAKPRSLVSSTSCIVVSYSIRLT
jgi:SIT4-associating protein SAP185/190